MGLAVVNIITRNATTWASDGEFYHRSNSGKGLETGVNDCTIGDSFAECNLFTRFVVPMGS